MVVRRKGHVKGTWTTTVAERQRGQRSLTDTMIYNMSTQKSKGDVKGPGTTTALAREAHVQRSLPDTINKEVVYHMSTPFIIKPWQR